MHVLVSSGAINQIWLLSCLPSTCNANYLQTPGTYFVNILLQYSHRDKYTFHSFRHLREFCGVHLVADCYFKCETREKIFTGTGNSSIVIRTRNSYTAPHFVLQLPTQTSSTKGNDAHLRVIIQSEKKWKHQFFRRLRAANSVVCGRI